MQRLTGFRRWVVGGGGLVLALLLAAAFIWRDDILRTALDPKQPFQTYRPPPAPNYAKAASWALIPAKPDVWKPSDPPADVFFVHPTTYDGGLDWNGPIRHRGAARMLDRVMLPNYAGPFYRVGRLFAPRYRQASLYTQLTLRDDAREAREFAYRDVREAFRFYRDHHNAGRPLVIVGVEQGGLLAARLVREEIASNPFLRDRLAGVYLIDTVVPRDEYGPDAPIPACGRKGEPRCVVAWGQAYEFDEVEAHETVDRALVWTADGHLDTLRGRPALCVNPLLGRESEDKAPARLNQGAASASAIEWATRPAFMARQVSAQCAGGVLRVSRPKSPSLKRTGGWADRLKEPGFNLFYADLEADALARMSALIHEPGYRPPVSPIGGAIQVQTAPIYRID